jgi:transposase-like protein
MGEAKRRTYTAGFKAKVGLEAIRGVRTVNEIGQEHGGHPAHVGQWKREIQEQAETLFAKKRGAKKEDGPGDAARLCSEIGRLKIESEGCRASAGGQSGRKDVSQAPRRTSFSAG